MQNRWHSEVSQAPVSKSRINRYWDFNSTLEKTWSEKNKSSDPKNQAVILHRIFWNEELAEEDIKLNKVDLNELREESSLCEQKNPKNME